MGTNLMDEDPENDRTPEVCGSPGVLVRNVNSTQQRSNVMGEYSPNDDRMHAIRPNPSQRGATSR